MRTFEHFTEWLRHPGARQLRRVGRRRSFRRPPLESRSRLTSPWNATCLYPAGVRGRAVTWPERNRNLLPSGANGRFFLIGSINLCLFAQRRRDLIEDEHDAISTLS